MRRPRERSGSCYLGLARRRTHRFLVFTPPTRSRVRHRQCGDAHLTVEDGKHQPRREHRQAGGEDRHLGANDAAKNPPISGGSEFASAWMLEPMPRISP